jgi:hypothetical protein
MNNNTTSFGVFIALGFGIVLILISFGLLSITNPKIEAKCQAKGGQVLITPGRISSCLYPAK